MICVSLRHLRNWERPIDPDALVARMDAPFGIFQIGGGMKVEHLTILSERLKAVRAPLRYDQAAGRHSIQNFPVPLQKGF
jgi:hypothetical protein